MNPSGPFIQRPVATSLLMAAILLVGVVAYTQLPVSALPEVDYPTIQVLTFYPGASPDVMATTVTAPLERQFGQLQGLSQMTSTSSGGSSVIVLQFALSLNIDIAEEEVQSSINAAQSFLPSSLPSPPVYSKTNPADAPVLTLAVTSHSIPLSQVEDLVDTRLAPKLSQLSGVGLVSISGGQKPAVRIQHHHPRRDVILRDAVDNGRHHAGKPYSHPVHTLVIRDARRNACSVPAQDQRKSRSSTT